jgi:hypothetical protein
VLDARSEEGRRIDDAGDRIAGKDGRTDKEESNKTGVYGFTER